MSDTPETDEINLLLENLDEWIDDSLENSKPIGLTLFSARRIIVDQRARITELWDALGMVSRQRDRMEEELNDAWKERDEARRERDEALKEWDIARDGWNKALEGRDEARMEFARVREELIASKKGNLILERDEAMKERDEAKSIISRLVSRRIISWGDVAEALEEINKLKEEAK